MSRMIITLAALGILGTGTIIAQTSQRGDQMPTHDPGMMKQMQKMMPDDKDGDPVKEYKQAHMRMMQDTPDFTGDADKDFRLQMIPHHQAAIDMAKVALKYAKDDQTKKLAQDIIAAQEKEIADMQAWLKAHETPAQ